MSESDYLYTKTHEWVRPEGDGTCTVGITQHAQELLGDMVFVELPEVGKVLAAGQECGVVESVKAASDVYAPVAGTVVAINDTLSSAPEQINQDPYGAGWMMRLQLANTSALDGLLDATAYGVLVAEEEH